MASARIRLASAIPRRPISLVCESRRQSSRSGWRSWSCSATVHIFPGGCDGHPAGSIGPMAEVVIVDAVRTPVGKRNGGLSTVHPAELLGNAVTALVDRTGVDPGDVG